MFGKEFKVLKELPTIYRKVGDNYPEFFYAYEDNGMLEYYIDDDMFGQPSLANTHEGEYAQKLRTRSSKILEELIEERYIEAYNQNTKGISDMSFKTALLHNIDYISKEIDDVETEDLIELGENVKKFYNLLLEEIDYRKSLK